MKRELLFLSVVAALLFVACHDEPVAPAPSEPTIRNVVYATCNGVHHDTVDDIGWRTLLEQLIASTEGGCMVSFWNPDAIECQLTDTVSISTTDIREAFRWGAEMYDSGCNVTIVYSEATSTCQGTAYPVPVDIISNGLPNSEWWECTQTNLGPLADGDNLLLNVSWDSGLLYAYTTSMSGSPTLLYNELTCFHLLNDTMYCDNPVYSNVILWNISYPDDSTMNIETVFYGGPGYNPNNLVYLYSFRRLNQSANNGTQPH